MLKFLEVKIGIFFLIFSLIVAFFLVPTIEDDRQHPSKEERHFYNLDPRFFPYLFSIWFTLRRRGKQEIKN